MGLAFIIFDSVTFLSVHKSAPSVLLFLPPSPKFHAGASTSSKSKNVSHLVVFSLSGVDEIAVELELFFSSLVELGAEEPESVDFMGLEAVAAEESAFDAVDPASFDAPDCAIVIGADVVASEVILGSTVGYEPISKLVRALFPLKNRLTAASRRCMVYSRQPATVNVFTSDRRIPAAVHAH